MGSSARAASDTVVVGGGVIGLLCALRLAQAGARVTLVERTRPGAQASSAAAGILGPQFENEAPGPLLEFGLRSRALHAALEEELNAQELSGSYWRCGALIVGNDENDLRARAQWMRTRGLAAEFIDGDAVHTLEPTLAPVRSGLFLRDEAQLDPIAAIAALTVAAERAGVRFRIDNVQRITADQHARTVVAENNVFGCDTIVITAGSWSSLLPGLELPQNAVTPIRGQMLAAQLPSGQLHHIVGGAGGYLVPRKSGRVLVGSTMERVGFDPRTTPEAAHLLQTIAATLAPNLGTTLRGPSTEHWAGLRPSTPDGLPLIGAAPEGPGVWFASGHLRNGWLLGPATAEAITQLVLGHVPALDLSAFDPARLAIRSSLC